MSSRLSSLLTAAILVATPALAQDVTGEWHATVQTEMGAVQLVFDLDANGQGLSGTVSANQMPVGTITDGTVENGEVMFKLPMTGAPGGPAITIEYAGTLSGNEIAFVSSFTGGPNNERIVTEFVARRAE